MNKIKLVALFTTLFISVSYASCKDNSISVEITNRSAIMRNNESVVIDWGDISKRMNCASPKDIIVLDSQGVEIPSQALYNGEESVQSLLFQCSVRPKQCVRYSIVKGVPSYEYKQAAYGRFAPDRRDDFIWENNLIAYRIYGKSLEKNLVSPGIDILLKRTPEMVINKWLKPNAHYHEDHGDGLDMYDVGKTLGVGAMTPIDGEKLVYPSNNYATYRVLDCGVLRISFELRYPSFRFRGEDVTMVRRVTLDASTNLNKMEVSYSGAFKSIDVVNGIQLRKGHYDGVSMGDKQISYIEPTDPKNGTTYLLVINPDGADAKIVDGHVVALMTLKAGERYSYFAGGYWSKYGVPSKEAWDQIVANEILKIESPLRIKIGK